LITQGLIAELRYAAVRSQQKVAGQHGGLHHESSAAIPYVSMLSKGT